MLNRKKLLIWGIVIIAVITAVLVFLFTRNGADKILTDTVKRQDLKRTVLATGEVTSETDVNLSFKATGMVAKIVAKIGQQVKEGDILANLDQKDQLAGLTQAKGALAQARANYNKVVSGADTPAVNVAKASVAAAETALRSATSAYFATVKQQDTLVRNAELNFYNAGLIAKRSRIVADEVTATLSGAYQGTAQGTYNFQVIFSVDGFKVQYWGIENGVGTENMKRGVPTRLGTKGLYVTFSTTGSFDGNPTWTVQIPNPESSTYLTNLNSYNAAVRGKEDAVLAAQNAVDAAQASLDQANSSLAQVLASARPEDVEVARAQVLAAQGQVEAAQANLESTVIRAPANGTITSVDIKVGQQVSPTETAIVLQDIDNLYVEANISEANIAGVAAGQPVEYTFDAVDGNQIFKGEVTRVDPSSTMVSGVVNFKITATVEKLEVIKPGMTANLKIISAAKDGALVVPQRSIVKKNGAEFLRVITDSKRKKYTDKPVSTGVLGDGGMVEIISGLTDGDEIVTDIKEQ